MKIAHIRVDKPEHCPHYNAYHDFITHKITRTICYYPGSYMNHPDKPEDECPVCGWPDKCPLEGVQE